MQSLEIVSVNIWQILISLANLTILYTLLKKFLYKPVKAVIEGRKAAIARDYAQAEAARTSAEASRDEYEAKLAGAQDTANSIIHEATQTADRRSERIVADARSKAEGIVRQGEMEAAMEKQKAQDSIRREIADVSAALTEKLLSREINEGDHRGLIDSFLQEMGDGQ